MDRMDQIGLNKQCVLNGPNLTKQTKWTEFIKVDQMNLIGPSGPHWTEVD